MLATNKMADLKHTTTHKEIESPSDIHEYKTNEGYVIDAGDVADNDLKLARDVSLFPSYIVLSWLRLFKQHCITQSLNLSKVLSSKLFNDMPKILVSITDHNGCIGTYHSYSSTV